MLKVVSGFVAVALLAIATPAAADCKLAKLIEFPITIIDGRPATSVKINGQDAKLFVNNSVYFSLLHASSARRLHTVGSSRTIDIVDPLRPNASAGVVRAKSLSATGLDLKDVDFLSEADGRDPEVDGSLGQNLLKLGDTEFDLRGGIVRILTSTGCGEAPLAYWDEAKKGFSAMPADSNNEDHFTLAETAINGEPAKALLASGVTFSFLTEAGAKRRGLIPANAPPYHLADRHLVHVDDVKLGDEEVRNFDLPVAQFGVSETPEKYDMVLGVDFLMSHHVYVARDQKQVYFTYSGGKIFAQPPVTTSGVGTSR